MMSANAGARRLKHWIEGFLEYTEILQSPLILRKWAGIATVAAAMERRVWVRTMGAELYPNLYILLVAPPGVGKSVAILEAEKLFRAVPAGGGPEVHTAPSDMTSASLIDALNESVRRLVRPGDPPYVEFNAMTIFSRELGVLVPAWETSLMNNLTDIYDGNVIDQKRRGKDLKIKIPHPQINLLGATTPSYLNEVMPAGAWDQGFVSRIIMIYSGENTLRDLFSEEIDPRGLAALNVRLLEDLRSMANAFGKMDFTVEAVAAIRAWQEAGLAPVPEHNRLQHYNTRRRAHLVKLCMVSAMARGSMIIDVEHYSEALSWLIEAETYMPDIFKSMSAGGDSAAMEDTWHFVWATYAKERKPIAEHRIVHFLRERVPAHSVMRVLDVMVRSRMIEPVNDQGSQSGIGYKPVPKLLKGTG